jgi:hypothetical protein
LVSFLEFDSAVQASRNDFNEFPNPGIWGYFWDISLFSMFPIEYAVAVFYDMLQKPFKGWPNLFVNIIVKVDWNIVLHNINGVFRVFIISAAFRALDYKKRDTISYTRSSSLVSFFYLGS